MDEQLIDRLMLELKAARIAVGAAHGPLAEIRAKQAELGKSLVCFLTIDPSPVAVRSICRQMLGTLSAEDQAEAKFQAAVDAHEEIRQQLQSASE